MIYPQIRCYQPNMPQQSHVFYILCKGNQAGKPSLKPWANSFAVSCQNLQYFNFYYWLVYALFRTNKFKLRLRGSVIPFINIDDVRDLIGEMAPVVYPDWSKFQELVNTLNKFEDLKSTLEQQIISSERLQNSLLQQYFMAGHKPSGFIN